ncbi:hypothetical protein V2J09_014861 [Rumex salicifolius]
MATKQFSGDALASNLAGLSKTQLYDIMSQMKTLIEQNPEQARQILIQNPPLTRALFQAQIMLGMVQPSQPIQTIPPKSSQQVPSSVQPSSTHGSQLGSHDPTNVAQAQNPVRRQQPNQPPGLIPGVHAQPMASQQHRSHLNAQASDMPSLPHLQPPLPSVSASHLPLQPPLTQSRPGPGPPSHQYQPGMGPNMNYQHPGAQQMHHLQPSFNSNMKPPNSNVMGPPFPHGQPPFPNQHPPQYQGGNPHLGADFNNRGGPMQVDRGGSQWQGGPPVGGSQLPGPPSLAPAQMGSQPGLANPISPDLEQMLQQVMSLPIEQINELPPEQRNQLLI